MNTLAPRRHDISDQGWNLLEPYLPEMVHGVAERRIIGSL